MNHIYTCRCDRHMTNDDDGNMDTTNPLMDKEHFNKEDLLLVDQDDEEIDKVNILQMYLPNTVTALYVCRNVWLDFLKSLMFLAVIMT